MIFFNYYFLIYIYFRVIWEIEVVLDQQLNAGLLCETAHLISPAGLKFQLLIVTLCTISSVLH